MDKRTASHLAKALDFLGRARFRLRSAGAPEHAKVDRIENELHKVFRASGYEYASPDSTRIREARPEPLRLPGTGAVVLGNLAFPKGIGKLRIRHTRSNISESQRRDEKHGLYGAHVDPAN